MPETLLRTKLFIPPIRPNLVRRPRLIGRLNEGLHSGHKLTLISAPAGFGKTTLVSEWIAEGKRPSTWISLDEGDNELPRFLTYLVVALQTIGVQQSPDGNVGERVLAILQSPQRPPTESILTILLNEITTISEDFVLVLDDYHAIDAKLIDNALAFLIAHLPPQMHLVITTREDPLLPLARLRARGQMTELRVTDLRFTLSETAEFLNRMMGFDLPAADITALETRTEGWVAGLQLAALSMRGHQDAASFIQSFTGSHHFVLDYLVEEVLQQQPDAIQAFLLRTSILDRMCGRLCDAVMDETAVSGQETLENLHRANLFIVPLDHERHWYRYHHLFADLLRQQLRQTVPEQIPTLHNRASQWFERNGSPADAVRHAVAAEDFERVAGLAEIAWQAMDNSFQSADWLGWVKRVPDELIRNRPVLSTQYAWALWMEGELEASEARLRDAERWLEPNGKVSPRPEGARDAMVVMNEEQFRVLPAMIALARSQNAQALGDVSGTVKYAELVIKLIPEENLLLRAQATVSLGFAHWMRGDLESAHRALAGWINSMHTLGNIVFAIASTFALADILVAQGRLRDAVSAYQKALSLAPEHDKDVQRVIAHLYLGLAMLYHEMGDQEAAAQNMLKSKELGEFSTLPDWPSRWSLAQAQLKESAGELEAALELLDRARLMYIRNVMPDIRPIEALKARVYVRQGRLSQALSWVNEQGLFVDGEFSYLREFEYITLARVLIARFKNNLTEESILEVTGLLERLLEAAEEGGRIGSVIEIQVLQAFCHQAQGNITLAHESLERALVLAEPEGYFRIFVDEGAPMAALLKSLMIEDENTKAYVSKLLDALAGEEVYPSSQAPHPLVDPLSKRESDVLKLLTTELTGPEIARELMVSMNTIRTHTKNIYSKLGVTSRRDAVRKAKELRLI